MNRNVREKAKVIDWKERLNPLTPLAVR